MRIHRFAFFPIILLALSFCLAAVCLRAADAEQDPAKKEYEEKKKKLKIPALKFDAWCVFSDLAMERPPLMNDMKSEFARLESDHSRPGTAGLGGFGRRGKWAHVVLDLLNTTDPKDKTVFEGFGEIILNPARSNSFGNFPYETTYRQAFSIGPQSEKQYHFSVFCPEDGWAQQLSLRIANKRDSTLGARDFTLYDLDPRNEELIVVVSDTPGAFKYLGPRPKNISDVDALDRDRPLGHQVASVTPSELPSRWHDLTLASLVIIDGPPAEPLNDEQWDALKTYAQSGGKILIMAGKDPARLKGAIEDLCGITVRSSTELSSLDQLEPPITEAFRKEKDPDTGLEKDVPWRLPVIDVTANSAGVVKRNTKTKTVEYCARSYGAGLVAFLPFSLNEKMLEHWPGRQNIPVSLLRADKNLFANESFKDDSGDEPPVQYPNYRNRNNPDAVPNQNSANLASFRSTLDNSFENDTPVVMQSPQTVLRFLLLYLACAVPANFLLFSLLKRREAAWMATPLLAIAFTVIAYYVGYSGQTGVTTVNEVSVVEAGPGQSEGVGRTFMGVYAPRRDDYHIEFPQLKLSSGSAYDFEAAPGHLINPGLFEQKNIEFPKMTVLDTGQRLQIEAIRIQQRSTRRFEIQHRAWLNGGVDLKFAAADGDEQAQPKLVVTNNTGRALFNPIFIKNGSFTQLGQPNGGEFKSGDKIDTRELNNGWSADTGVFEFLMTHYPRSADPHRADRAAALTNYLRNHTKQYAAGVFIAWMDGALLPVQVGQAGYASEDPHSEGITLLLVPAEVNNRGGKFITLSKSKPKLSFAFAYTPDNKVESGDWKPVKGPVEFKMSDFKNEPCLYLRLQFDPNFAQYYYENKAAQLTFQVKYLKSQGDAPDFMTGALEILTRSDAANNPRERFKTLSTQDAGPLEKGKTQEMQPIVFQFNDFKLFTGDSIILKIKPVNFEQGNVRNLAVDKLELKLIDR